MRAYFRENFLRLVGNYYGNGWHHRIRKLGYDHCSRENHVKVTKRVL